MAIAFDAAATGVQPFGTGLTYAHTCTGTDRALFVTVAAGANVSGVTYGGVAMTILSGTGTGLVLAGLLNPASGTNNVIISLAGTETCNATSASYTGVDQTTGWDNLADATTGDGSPSVSVTSATGNLVVGGSAWVDNTGAKSHTAVAPVTERADEDGADTQTCAAIGDAPGAASVTFAWTRNGGGAYWAQRIAAVSVLQATSAGPTIDTQPQSQSKLVGETATFTVAATTSGGTLSYQWKRNGSNVGTDSDSYTTPTLVIGDDGDTFTVDVTDSNGTTVSATATLTVGTGPVIMQPDPTDGSGAATATVTSDVPLSAAGEMLLVTFTRGAVTLRTTCWPETP